MILNIHNQKGVTLLISIIILSVVTLTTLIIAGLIVREFRLSLDVASSETAYYAAEAGAEEALWEFNNNGSFLNEIDQSVGDLGKYDVTTLSSIASLSGNLEKDKSKQITIKNSNITQLNISCSSFNPDGNVWVETTILSWNKTTPIVLDNVNKKLYSPTELTNLGNSILITTDTANKNYKIRFKPLYGSMNYTVTAKKAESNANVPGEIDIRSKGLCKDTKRGIEVTMSQEPGIIGVFDYVLFSDERLIK